MASITLVAAVNAFAGKFGVVLWEGIPSGGARVFWPGTDVSSFLEVVGTLAPAVVYLSPDSEVVAVSISGVVHVFDPDQRESEIAREAPRSYWLGLDDEDDDDELSPEMEELAKQIAMDERFTELGWDIAEELLDASGLDLDRHLSGRIIGIAQVIFSEGVGEQLEKESRGIVRELIKHPDFDPLTVDFRDDRAHSYIDQALVGRDPRLKEMVQQELQNAAWKDRDKAEREVQKEAEQLLQTIPRLVLDHVGFASRNASRGTLLEPFLESVTQRRRELTGYWIKKLDGERGAGRKLEFRYAAASQRLHTGVATRSSIARQLQLSPSTVDRLLRSHVPNGFEFDADDPIVTELAPELGG
jgi:hypothetical protein